MGPCSSQQHSGPALVSLSWPCHLCFISQHLSFQTSSNFNLLNSEIEYLLNILGSRPILLDSSLVGLEERGICISVGLEWTQDSAFSKAVPDQPRTAWSAVSYFLSEQEGLLPKIQC